MSRRSPPGQNQQQRPIINGNTAFALESALAPPSTTRQSPPQRAGGLGAQHVASTTGQSIESIRAAVPLLRDPRYHIVSINEDAERRRVTVHVRPQAERSTSQQQQQPPRTEYTFALTLSDDRRQISNVEMILHAGS